MAFSNSPLASLPTVTKNLLIINFICWLATIALPNIFPNFNLVDTLGMHYWASEKFNIAQLFTYQFLHGGFTHAFFNMFSVYMFGAAIEQYWGSKRYLMFYLIAGVGAGVVQQLIWTIDLQAMLNAINTSIEANSPAALLHYEAKLRTILRFGSLENATALDMLHMKNLIANAPLTIGASGAVFGLLFGFGYLFPEARMMLIFLPVPIKARAFVAIYAVAELFLGVANFSGDNIAHFAHLGGMLFGWIMIVMWRKKGNLFS